MTEKPYMVIYPKGDRSTLSTAYVRFYQKDEWDLASTKTFETREGAEGHARLLARVHGLALDEEIPLLLDDTPGEEAEMRLYFWHSRAMSDYYPGQIIVMASSVDAARGLVRKRFEQEARATPSTRAQLEDDLSAQPDILTSGVALIRGGD